MSSFFLIFLAGISQGLANTIRKKSSTLEHRATTITTTTMLVNAVLALPLLFYHPQFPTQPMTWILTLLSAAIFSLASAFFFKSYQHTDLSLSTLIQRSNVLFISVLGIAFLGERVSPSGVVGLILVFIGSIITLIEHKKITLDKGSWYALATSVLGAIASVIDKRVLQDFSPYTYVVVNNFLVGLMFLVRPGTASESIRFLRKYPRHIVTSSILGMGGFTVLMGVLSKTQVSQTMPVYKTVSFFVPVVLGILVYGETKKLHQKLVGILLAVMGTALIYW